VLENVTCTCIIVVVGSCKVVVVGSSCQVVFVVSDVNIVSAVVVVVVDDVCAEIEIFVSYNN
jgi:hypothetical protein